MNFLRIAKEDIGGIFKNRFIRVSIVAIIVVPLLYSLLYLYAFWDPYSRLESLHVAVVNKDNGAVMDGKEVNYGKDVEEELRSNNEIGWKITNEEDANDGLENKGYYAKVIIPKDFSSKVLSAKDGSPEYAKIEFITNDKKNFLAAQINSKVEAELKGKLNQTVAGNYIEVAFNSLYEAKDGLVQAADGSKKIYDGLSTLNDSVPALADGANDLADGSSKLVNGQAALNNGITEVNKGTERINDGLFKLYGKVPALSDGVTALSQGTFDLKNGVSSAAGGARELANGSKSLYNAYTGVIYPSVEQLKEGSNLLNSKLIDENSQKDMARLNEGANKVYEASSTLSVGYNDIYNGVNTLVSGVEDSSTANANVMALLSQAASTNDVNTKNDLINKALQISKAVNEKAQGSAKDVEKLSKGNSYFNDKLNEFTNGSKELANGTTLLIGKVSEVKSGVGQLNDGLNNLYKGINPVESEFGLGLKSIADNNANLNIGLNKLNSGAEQLNNGTKALSSNLPELRAGITELYNGSGTLKGGTNALSSGSYELVNGQSSLNNGILELTSKVPELTDGVTKLYDGGKELSDKLDEGASKLKDGLVNPSKDMGEFASKAVNMNFESINSIPNYGTGFAPYFIPLSLWIGAIMMFFVIPPKVKNEEGLSKVDKVLGKYISYAFVGVLQALLVSVVVLILGLKPTSTLVYILTNVFLSLVFIAIIQCLISLLGDAGRLLGIVLLILQLTACAGTFPLEVVPSFFKVLNPFMPFTYAVEALREVVSADVINYSIIGKDFLILGLILVGFLSISILFKNIGEGITAKLEGRKLGNDINTMDKEMI